MCVTITTLFYQLCVNYHLLPCNATTIFSFVIEGHLPCCNFGFTPTMGSLPSCNSISKKKKKVIFYYTSWKKMKKKKSYHDNYSNCFFSKFTHISQCFSYVITSLKTFLSSSPTFLPNHTLNNKIKRIPFDKFPSTIPNHVLSYFLAFILNFSWIISLTIPLPYLLESLNLIISLLK